MVVLGGGALSYERGTPVSDGVCTSERGVRVEAGGYDSFIKRREGATHASPRLSDRREAVGKVSSQLLAAYRGTSSSLLLSA